MTSCLSTVVQNYKNFTDGWQWDRRGKIDDAVTRSTSSRQHLTHDFDDVLVHQVSVAGEDELISHFVREVLRHDDSHSLFWDAAVEERLTYVRNAGSQSQLMD